MDIYDIVLKHYNDNRNQFSSTKYLYLLINRFFINLEKKRHTLLLKNTLILILNLLEIDSVDLIFDIGENLRNLSRKNKSICLKLLKSELDEK